MENNWLNAFDPFSEERSSSFSKDKRNSSNASLSIIYLPSQFSNSSTLVSSDVQKRKGTRKDVTGLDVKRAGGFSAFKSRAARCCG